MMIHTLVIVETGMASNSIQYNGAKCEVRVVTFNRVIPFKLSHFCIYPPLGILKIMQFQQFYRFLFVEAVLLSHFL